MVVRVKHQASARISAWQNRKPERKRCSTVNQSSANSAERGAVRQRSRSFNRSCSRSSLLLLMLAAPIWQLVEIGRGLTSHRCFGRRRVLLLAIASAGISFLAGQGVGMVLARFQQLPKPSHNSFATGDFLNTAIARPQLSPLPVPQETWNCDVVVIGGSLGGVAAASHAMQSGAVTCLIELTPWLGGQISSQGVSALDESQEMRGEDSFSQSWTNFKQLISQQPVKLPSWTGIPDGTKVTDINSCWVGLLCFPPQAGASAAEQLLQTSAAKAPGSQWSKSTAFKGAKFDHTGREITAVYAVRRVPRDPNYLPKGRLSAELPTWYKWESDDEFEKIPLKIQAPAGKRLMVIDATDTNELIGWARVPYRLGSDSLATTGERNASRWDNSDCTQAFTYPFTLAIHDDKGASLKTLETLESVYPKEEHRSDFDLQGFPMFTGRSVFNYRRIVSTVPDNPYTSTPQPGDMTAINWNRGNDWKFMDPPLILNTETLDKSGQRENWMGGLSLEALQHAEFHALLFAHWLLEHHRQELPLAYVSGPDSPMGTLSGLSMTPYIREGRRIAGIRAYGQREFAVREMDLRRDMQGKRDFSQSAIARIHYSIDIHGCRYRQSDKDGEASSASVMEEHVQPTLIPLEALIPQGIDNLLIGGKGIAVTHIANGMTRIHQSEWSIGAAAGATAGWLVTQPQTATLKPIDIVAKRLMPQLREHMNKQGLGFKLPNTQASDNFLKALIGNIEWDW
ncbi:pyruvate/2-oxoglutarate dehydrogenase complex, dihydrolipoamide dehydrogenase component [Leptolyngbyaceae cyanobacterium JSC-12]|nr:pyruvate/2-oxoglutarate dehydrogenase complex, dihydrolipoamide dehydrogenase component [Leptolyngbyaceae cyanobacterium JSC-12]